MKLDYDLNGIENKNEHGGYFCIGPFDIIQTTEATPGNTKNFPL